MTKRRIPEMIGFLLGWFALITQFVLMLLNREADIPETLIRFFSFFTILTNLLVALFFTSKLISGKGFLMNLFKKRGALTALTLFILIVGLVYQFVLRGLWQPTGLQFIVDELLHSIIPLYVLIYWIKYVTQDQLRIPSVLSWLLYPLFYVLFILIRGYFSGFYPYPFFNVTVIGYKQFGINLLIIFSVSMVLMIALVLIGRRISHKK